MDAWIQGIEQIWAASTKIKTRKVILYTPPPITEPKGNSAAYLWITAKPVHIQILLFSDNLTITYPTRRSLDAIALQFAQQ